MKKQYTTPTIEVVEIEMQQPMLTQSNEQTEAGSSTGGSGQGTPDFATQKRGSWGDLWN